MLNTTYSYIFNISDSQSNGDNGGHLFSSSQPLPPLHKHLNFSWEITAEIFTFA